ncbi:hypothetical protein MHYP_G00142600 [Metynnis hypsauchen]
MVTLGRLDSPSLIGRFSSIFSTRRAGGQDGEHQEWKKREATQDLYALLFPYLFYFRRKKTERGGKKEMSVKPSEFGVRLWCR